MEVFWFLPTHGDGRYLGTSYKSRTFNYAYARQIAQATDELGYSGLLIPTGRSCEDAWVLASSLVPVTQRLKFLVAVRPGLMSPTLSARMTATLDRISNGRLLINVVTGGAPEEHAGDGQFLNHDARYEVTDEFLQIWRHVLQGEKYDFNGKHLSVAGAHVLFPPTQHPYPPLFFGGSSPVALEVAAKHVNVYLTWGEPPLQVEQKIAKVRQLAEGLGRSVKFGIRLHVIVRESDAEAWEAADDLIRYLDDDTIAAAQKTFSTMDSEGQKRMATLNGGSRSELEVSPNLWAGIGLVRGGAGTALVGNPKIIATKMQEYAELGIEKFVLSGYPHLEEAYRFAELVFPLLPLSNLPAQPLGKPRGEVVANEQFPDLLEASQNLDRE